MSLHFGRARRSIFRRMLARRKSEEPETSTREMVEQHTRRETWARHQSGKDAWNINDAAKSAVEEFVEAEICWRHMDARDIEIALRAAVDYVFRNEKRPNAD